MRRYMSFGFMAAFVLLSGCTKSTSAPKETLAATEKSEKLENIVRQQQSLTPQSCNGVLGLDIAAFYGAYGPNFYKSVQTKRADFIADDYFSGDFLNQKPIAHPDVYTVDGFNNSDLDNIFGNIIPLAYMAMCQQNQKLLNQLIPDIKNAGALLATPASDIDVRLYSRAKPLLQWLEWEVEFALADISDNHDALQSLLKKIEKYAKVRTDSAGRLFANDLSLKGQHTRNYPISIPDRARFDLLLTNIQIQLALLKNDKKDFFRTFANYQRIYQTLDKQIRGRGGAVFDGSHADIFSGSHYIKSMVLFQKLKAWDLLLQNEHMHPLPRPAYKPGRVPALRIYEQTKPIDYDLDFVVTDFEQTSRRLTVLLLHEDGKLLWALHQNIRYEFYTKLASIRATTNNRNASPEHKNSVAHCRAYHAWLNATKVLPHTVLKPNDQSWCSNPR